MAAPGRQVSLKRTMRDSPPGPGKHQSRALEMDSPLRYSPSKHYNPPAPAADPRLFGQTGNGERAYADPDVEQTPHPRAHKAHHEPSSRNNAFLGGGPEELSPVKKRTSRREQYMTNPQKFRLRLKNHLLAMIGEYVGTVLFLFFAFGGAQVANIPSTSITGSTTTANAGTADAAAAQSPNTSSLQFIALSFGFSLTVNAWVFFRISGGLFNPAISFGLALVGVITPVRAVLLSISQFLGGITAAAIIQAILPGPLYITTRLATGMSRTRGMFLEAFLTAMLMLTIFLLAAEKSKTTFLAPVGIGLALFITQLVGVYYTGAGVNPARSMGPDVVIRQFTSYAWIYYVGPLLGTLAAAGFYKMMKVLHYETVVPGQDAEDDDEALEEQTSHDELDAEEKRNPNIPRLSAPKLDSAQGPGIGDYAAQGSNLGPDLSSQRRGDVV